MFWKMHDAAFRRVPDQDYFTRHEPFTERKTQEP